jgi:CheY-like chemotaxis protein
MHIGADTVESLKKFHYSDNKRDRNTRIRRVNLSYAKVLIVDDNLTNLDVARGFMKSYKMKIDCVDSGQKALELIQARGGEKEKGEYDAIFMDHMMPGMNGIEAMRAIRKIGTRYAKSVPIVALTANAISGNEEFFLGKGFQAFLTKPINLLRLDEILRHWVRNIEKEQLLPVGELFVEYQYVTGKRRLTKEIAGLSIYEGIENFNGDEKTYLNILRSYATNTGKLLGAITDVTENNLERYAITVHTIKGSSCSICAHTIGALAENLENASNVGDFNYIFAHNDVFVEAVWKLIHDIEEVLSDIDMEKPRPKKDKPDGEMLAKLLAACKEYDIDGVDEAMSEIEEYQYEADGGLTDWIKENVKTTNFKQIIERLSK